MTRQHDPNDPSPDAETIAETVGRAIDNLADTISEKEIGDMSLNEKLGAAAVEIAHYLYENKIDSAFHHAFVSLNERDERNQPMNLADAGFAIANAIHHLAEVIGKKR